MKIITKYYIDHPFLSHSIFPENKTSRGEKEFEGEYANDDPADHKEERCADIEEDSIHSLHNKRKGVRI